MTVILMFNLPKSMTMIIDTDIKITTVNDNRPRFDPVPLHHLRPGGRKHCLDFPKKGKQCWSLIRYCDCYRPTATTKISAVRHTEARSAVLQCKESSILIGYTNTKYTNTKNTNAKYTKYTNTITPGWRSGHAKDLQWLYDIFKIDNEHKNVFNLLSFFEMKSNLISETLCARQRWCL